MQNWHDLATTSHYQTAVAVKDAFHDGDTANPLEGLEELIDALARSERRALRSQLIRTMQHVVKWQLQPDHHSWSWVATIRNARREIADIQQETPSLTRPVLEAMWDDCLAAARARRHPWLSAAGVRAASLPQAAVTGRCAATCGPRP